MSPPAFALREAALCFGPVTALAGVDLTVGAGERVAVVGASGAGKSSVVALLNGSRAPTAGTAETFGRPLASAPARERRRIQRRVGTVPQDLDLVDALRVVHNVNAGRLGEWPLRRALASLVRPQEGEAAAALGHVGLEDRLHARTAALSGGERRRVAVARVLVQRPDAILADEPTAGLDRTRARQVLDLLLDAAPTVVVCLHDLALLDAGFDRVVGLHAGRVTLDVPAAAVDDPALDRLYAGKTA